MARSGEIELASGRTVYVRELRQSQFYEGLLEGLPTVEMNRRGVEGILRKERERYDGAEPLLVPPKESPIEYGGGTPYPFGVPAALPGIVCVARLTSLKPARDMSKDFSRLCVVWFQAEFAFPIDPEVRGYLGMIDWGRHAVDLEY
jgi:hypothetical protein